LQSFLAALEVARGECGEMADLECCRDVCRVEAQRRVELVAGGLVVLVVEHEEERVVVVRFGGRRILANECEVFIAGRRRIVLGESDRGEGAMTIEWIALPNLGGLLAGL